MKYFNNIVETIGNTPLIKFNHLAKDIKATVLAKVEYFNPGGSVKDRIGIEMILDAEEKGLIKDGYTIVEATSGNTGVGLAMVAALKGYKMIFTMADKQSKEKEFLLRAYGAEVIRCPTGVDPEDSRSIYKVAEKIRKEIPNSFYPNQYFNQNNPKAHYKTTGPEIWKDTDGKITHFIAGIGTCGTITGVGRYLKEKNPEIKIIGVDPEGSMLHEEFYKTHGKVHSYTIQGIGEDIIPETVDFSVIDEILIVNDKEALLMTRRLAREEGLIVGQSSGAAVLKTLEFAKKLDKNSVVVVLLPDNGRNYLSNVFNDDWMSKKGFL